VSIKAMKWAYSLFELVDMPPPERAVLLALCWEHTDKGGCFPSQSRISLLSGYRERRVRDILASLESQGLIKRTRRSFGARGKPTVYRLFGTITGPRLPVDYRHSPAGNDYRPPSADYRGTNNKGQACAKLAVVGGKHV